MGTWWIWRRTVARAEVCDLCGRLIEPEPDLWDKQGQPVWITWAAYSQRMWLCSTCQDKPIKLNDLRTVGQRKLQGSMVISENLAYMPLVGEKENPAHEEPGG